MRNEILTRESVLTDDLQEDADTCMQQLSMIMLSYSILGYSSATSAQLWRNRPSPNFLLKKKKKRQQWVSVTVQKPPTLHLKTGFLLHDIGFVNSCDFLPALFGGIIEGKLGNAPGLLSGDYLQTLNYPGNTLKKPKTHAVYENSHSPFILS